MKLSRARRPRRPAWTRLDIEVLEDRLAPAANILVSVDGPSTQQSLKAYTPQGTLVETLTVPPGAAQQDAYDLVAGADGRVHVFNGSSPSYLSTYDPAAGTWGHRTHTGWNTSTDGGVAVYQNFAFATDAHMFGDALGEKGIVRFNLSDGTATRFATNLNPGDLAVGGDGLLYAHSFQTINVYDPQTLAHLRTLSLPSSVSGASQFYSGIAVNANGDIYACTSSNRTVHRFDSAGTLLGSVTLATSVGWLFDIDLSADGTQVVVGSNSGNVALMSSSLTDVTWFGAGTNLRVYVSFAYDWTPYPRLRVNDVSVTEGNTGTATATFTVSLASASSQTVTVDWSTADGTAGAGSDYTAAGGSLTFTPGETSKTVTVAVLGDTTDEPGETFTVNLSGASGAPVADGQGVGTITDDDVALVAIGDVTVSESAGQAVFTVSLSAASGWTVTVNYATQAFTAVAGSDFTAVSGTLTFAPGETSKTIAVPVINDTEVENGEAFFVSLSGLTNASSGDSQGRANIVNDDLAGATITDVTVAEGDSGTVSATFTVTLSASSPYNVSLNWATAWGTAMPDFALPNGDYVSASGTLNFVLGETSKSVTVTVRGDVRFESDETFFVNLSNPSGLTIADGQGVGTIIDNDPYVLDFSDVSVSEAAGEAVFTVTLSQPSSQTVTVNYATSVFIATAGVDYSDVSGTLTFEPGETVKTVAVPIHNDNLYEQEESFAFDLSGAVGAKLGLGRRFGRIQNDEPYPAVSIDDVSVVEGDTGSVDAVFTVSLNNPTYQTVDVFWVTQDDTATWAFDYGYSGGTVSFSPGQTTRTIVIPVRGDILFEPDETFIVVLGEPTNAVLADGLGVCTILASDPPVLSVNDVTVVEGSGASAEATFTVTLSAASSETVTVDWSTADGTAAAGSDYTAVSGSLTFAPGQTSKTVTVTVQGDTTDEPNETFVVNLSGAAGAVVADGQGVGTITDNDAAPTFAISDVTLAESAGPAVFTVTLSAISGWTVTVNYETLDFTADEGSDFIPVTGTLTFAPGETSKTVAVAVVNDEVEEDEESFFVRLSGATNAWYTDSQGSATVLDDDPVLVSVNDVSVTEGDSGSVTATFTVTLSKPGLSSVWMDWATANGSANGVLDYTADDGTLVFSPGETSETFSVTVLGDLRTEANETFQVFLSIITGAVLADGQGVGTILDDDPHVLTVDNPTAVESAGQIVYTVTLSQPSAQEVTVNYATEDYMALAGSDYSAVSGTLVFAPGETVKSVAVAVTNDNRRESESELFRLRLSTPVNAKLGASVGNGRILDDDPVPSVTIHDVSVVEGDSGVTAAVFSVTLSNPTDWTVDLFWLADNGTASYLSDFAYSGGSLSFAPGETTRTISVSVQGDLANELDETFVVNLSSATNATVADGQGVCTILNDDFPPLANAGPDQTASEGAPVAFDGGGSSDPDGDALTYLWNFGDGSTADVVAPTHVFADNGTYTVTLTVLDGHGGSATDTLTVTVNNVAATAALTGPTGGVRGQARVFTFSAADPGPADSAAPFTYAINWGDGNTQTVTGPAGGVQIEHVFVASGGYTVSATATDKDGGTGAAASQAVTIVAAQLQGGELVVGGTTGVDTITLSRVNGSSVRAVVNGQNLGTFAVNGTVAAYGQAGNDLIQVTGSNFPRTVQFFGGAGNDTLDARSAAPGAVLVGGEDNDTLLGGSGRDLLFGELGIDLLRGGSNEDVLVGGVTDHDADRTALTALAAEWRRTDANLATRIAHLNGSQAGGLNDGYWLNAATVHDDGAVDELFGEGSFDWFIYVGTGASADHLNDWQSGDAALVL